MSMKPYGGEMEEEDEKGIDTIDIIIPHNYQ